MQARRRAFLKTVATIPVDKLVFLDESGLNLAMGRSHAWVPRGEEYVEPRPMNWGGNLTLLGAIRLSGWVQLSTMFATTTKDRFVEWFEHRLLPKLTRGDVVLLDNLRAHHDPRVVAAAKVRGIRVIYLPPYSPDLNPIEPAWALQKHWVRKCAPRHADTLVRVARQARHRVTKRHCLGWFAHCGYPLN